MRNFCASWFSNIFFASSICSAGICALRDSMSAATSLSSSQRESDFPLTVSRFSFLQQPATQTAASAAAPITLMFILYSPWLDTFSLEKFGVHNTILED